MRWRLMCRAVSGSSWDQNLGGRGRNQDWAEADPLRRSGAGLALFPRWSRGLSFYNRRLMKKMAFTMTPRVLVWVTNSGNIQMDLEQGRGKFIVVELKLRFLRNS